MCYNKNSLHFSFFKGLLGFGTDDGRIGTYNTLSTGKWNLFSSKHKGIVYEIHWRRKPKSNDDNCLFYSCASDGQILVSYEKTPNIASKPISSFLTEEKTISKVKKKLLQFHSILSLIFRLQQFLGIKTKIF